MHSLCGTADARSRTILLNGDVDCVPGAGKVAATVTQTPARLGCAIPQPGKRMLPVGPRGDVV